MTNDGSDRDAAAWAAIVGTKGIGPRAVYRIAVGLRDAALRAGDLIGQDHDEVVRRMSSFGASDTSAIGLAEALTPPVHPPRRPAGAEVLHPDSEQYPLLELHPKRPLPGLLYAVGHTHLLAERGVAIVGSRDASPQDVSLAQAVAAGLAGVSRNVVSGYARGVDEAGHLGAVDADGTTTAVLAEGIEQFKRRDSLEGSRHQTLVLSQFPPDARWRGHQAMARNATVAALCDAVIVIRSGDSGGTREMIRLCSRTGLPTVAVAAATPNSLHDEVDHLAEHDADMIVEAALGLIEDATPTLF